MPIGGRSARGVQDVLTQILARDFLEQQQAAQQAELAQRRIDAQAREAEDTRRYTEERGERTAAASREERRLDALLKRQEAQDEIAAGERREAGNARGVRRMLGEFVGREGAPKTSTSRAQLEGMALQEGVDLPASLTRPTPEEEDDRRVNLEKRLLGLRPQKADQPDQDWVIRGGKPTPIPKGTARPGDEPYDAVAARKAPSDEASPYSTERATRTVQSVDELMGKVNRWTTGVGSVLSRIPESDARNFAAELDTLKANIAFNELTQMREASKTGGALGQVSNIELGLLQSALGALDPGQSPANLRGQLQKIKGSIERWQQARVGGARALPSHETGGAGESAYDRYLRRRGGG